MTFPSRFLLQLTACSLLASSAFAQSPATPAEEKKPISEMRINFEFKGLKLAEAMEIVRSQLPDLNIVVPPSLASSPLGPLKLRNVSVEGLVRAITSATDGSIVGMFDGDDYLSFSSNEEALPRQETVCRVLSLRQYLAGKNEDDAERAIVDLKQVVAMARDQLEHARHGAGLKAPEFSVHPATKLLIVVGSPEAVAIVEEVVNAVSGDSTAGAPGSGITGGMMPGGSAPGLGGGASPIAPQGSSPGAGSPKIKLQRN